MMPLAMPLLIIYAVTRDCRDYTASIYAYGCRHYIFAARAACCKIRRKMMLREMHGRDTLRCRYCRAAMRCACMMRMFITLRLRYVYAAAMPRRIAAYGGFTPPGHAMRATLLRRCLLRDTFYGYAYDMAGASAVQCARC